MKTAYARSYYPPAPMIEIWLAAPERAFALGPLRAFIDTGADGSLIPAQMLKQLGVDLFDVKRLRSQWGESRSVETYLVDVGVGSLRLPLVEMVSDDASDEVLLGRNLLNLLHLALDGPKQVVEVRE
mgnify:CR=1 FL=1